MNIVVLCLSPLGDAIFATPALRALRYSYPEARIFVLASPPAGAVLKANSLGLQISVVPDVLELYRYLQQIRREKYDLAVGLSQWGSFFTRFCGVRNCADFSRLPSRKERQSVVDLCLDVITSLGLSCPSPRTECWWTEQDRERAERFLAQWQKQDEDVSAPMVAVHCGGRYFVRKRWPLEFFVKLIRDLTENYGVRVVLIGGKDDRENCSLIQKAVPAVRDTAGRLTVGETAAFLSRCRVFIGNDSGPLHLAAAVPIETIGLYGPTDPQQFYPYEPPRHTFLYKAFPCSPCYRFGGRLWQHLPRCSRAYCMEAIRPEEVLTRVIARLKPDFPSCVSSIEPVRDVCIPPS